MATITRYALVDRNNEESGDFDTYAEAEEAAKREGDVAVVAVEFEYSDTCLVWTPDGSVTWPPTNDQTEED